MARMVTPLLFAWLTAALLSPFAHAQEGAQCNVPGECVGILITVSDAGGVGDCVFACQQDTNCTWFVPTEIQNSASLPKIIVLQGMLDIFL